MNSPMWSIRLSPVCGYRCQQRFRLITLPAQGSSATRNDPDTTPPVAPVTIQHHPARPIPDSSAWYGQLMEPEPRAVLSQPTLPRRLGQAQPASPSGSGPAFLRIRRDIGHAVATPAPDQQPRLREPRIQTARIIEPHKDDVPATWTVSPPVASTSAPASPGSEWLPDTISSVDQVPRVWWRVAGRRGT